MRTSCIRHPEHGIFVRRYKWQIDALAESGIGNGRRTEIPHCAAELLSIFEYHYNNRTANRILRQLVEYANAKTQGPLRDIGDWMPYSMAYLEELLLGGRGTHVLTAAIEELVKIGFVSNNVPEDVTSFYSKNMKWYRLNVDFINTWIDENVEKSWKTSSDDKPDAIGIFGRRPDDITPAKTGPKGGAKQGKAETSAPAAVPVEIKNLGEFYCHIHAKTKAFVFDANRSNKVKARMKEPGRTIGMGAQAIIGCRLSEYHQGQNDNQEIYDDIELIFRNAKNFEAMILRAAKKGVTEEIALSHLTAFLDGQPSSYAKPGRKGAQTASKREEPTSDEPAMTDSEARRYREFARSIASFFMSGVTNSNIMDLIREHAELSNAGKGLTHQATLINSLFDAAKTFAPNGIDADIQIQIRAFGTAFSKLQSIQA